MTKNVKALMDQIDDVLAKTDEDARDVWALLTALRGADTGDYDPMDKYFTTSVLRAKLFPKTAKRLAEYAYGAFNNAPFVPGMNHKDALPEGAMKSGKLVPTSVPGAYPPNPHVIIHFNEAVRAFNRVDDPEPDAQ